MGMESKILRLGALTGLAVMALGSAASHLYGLRFIETLGALVLLTTPAATLVYVVYDAYKQKIVGRVVLGILTAAIIISSIVLALVLG